MLKDRDSEKFVAKKAKKVEEKIERTGEKAKPPKSGNAWHGAGKC
jgi:hypothetical protein